MSIGADFREQVRRHGTTPTWAFPVAREASSEIDDYLRKVYPDQKTIAELREEFGITHEILVSALKELGIYAPRTRVSAEEVKQIVALHDQGLSVRQIAKTIETRSQIVVRRVVEREGLTPNNPSGLTEEDEAHVLDLHRQGLTVFQIQERTRHVDTTIRRIFRKHTITPNTVHSNVSDEDQARIGELHAEGLTNIEIARTISRSKTPITGYLQKRKIAPNNKHDVTANERRVILDLHRKGETLGAIVAVQPRSEPTVVKVIKDAGLEPHTKLSRLKKSEPTVVRMWRGGSTLGEIVAETGHSHPSIRKMIEEAGEVIPSRLLSNEEKDTILRLDGEGVDAKAIGKQVNRSQRTVLTFLQKNADKRTGQRKPRSRPLTPEQRAEIVALHKDEPDLTQATIGRRYGVKGWVIQKVLAATQEEVLTPQEHERVLGPSGSYQP